MDKLSHYRTLIKQHLGAIEILANRQPTPGVETLCVFDDERDQYLLLNTGWAGDRRVRGATLYVRLKNGKIWIEEDWTEEGIGNYLVGAGVPKKDIVAAFHPPEVRPFTEFAIA
jgi:hypothetical protein